VDGGGLIGRTVVFVNSLASTNMHYTEPADVRYSQHVQPLLPIAKLPSTSVPRTNQLGISNQVQTILTELSEATPPNSIVAVLGVSFCDKFNFTQIFRTRQPVPRSTSELWMETSRRSST
jgi:hypothetical protein